MDVYRSNFVELLPRIKKSINDAAFIALDSEFTGLSTSSLYEPTLFDTPETRYQKLKNSLLQFTICQCGVSAFVPDPQHANRYAVHTYNFYVFSHPFGDIDTRFSCQSSALEFLTNHEFDFNKFIKKGVSYMNKSQERLLRGTHLANKVQLNTPSGYLRQLDENFVVPTLKQVDQLLEMNVGEFIEIDFVPKGLPQYLVLKSMESRQYPIKTDVLPDGKIIVTKLEIGNQSDYESLQNCYEIIMSEAVGFTHVIDEISQSKKPVVGHNLFLDLVLMYGKFHEPLPGSYSEFKRKVHSLFPSIYDTKLLAFRFRKEFKDCQISSTMLADLFELFDGVATRQMYTPVIQHGQDFVKYNSTKNAHEAGYDAYMTGYIFLRFAHLAANKDVSAHTSHEMEFEEMLSALERHENRVNIARASVRHLYFAGNDPPIDPPERFLITNKEKASSLSAAQVAQAFLSFGSVDVKLMDNRRAIVAVSNRTRARDVVKAFQRNKFYTVVKYDWLHHSTGGKNLKMFGSLCVGGILIGALGFLAYRSKNVKYK